MSNSWDHLPNAKYIDAIIASVKAHPDTWDTLVDINSLFVTARLDVISTIEHTARYDVWNQIHLTGWFAATSAILTLIAYDDCAYMLDSEPNELEILARLGDNKAVLCLPACKALAAIKEKENV